MPNQTLPHPNKGRKRPDLARRNFKHGLATRNSPHPLYDSWAAMIARCSNPNNHDYQHYGGRGIRVCRRWRNFTNFLSDMGERPKGLEIDRIDNDGNYCPSNCRWATRSQQMSNIRPKSAEHLRKIWITRRLRYGVCGHR